MCKGMQELVQINIPIVIEELYFDGRNDQTRVHTKNGTKYSSGKASQIAKAIFE